MTTEEPLKKVVEIKWVQQANKSLLKFEFLGPLDENQANDAIDTWRKEFEKVGNSEKVDLIWNCLAMERYSAKSAGLWKDAMAEFKEKIDTIWLVTTNTFIKMGAKTITFLLPVNLRVISSEQLIK